MGLILELHGSWSNEGSVLEVMTCQYTKEARETIVHGDREDTQCSIGVFSVLEVGGNK